MTDLLAETAALVAVPSLSHEEARLADLIEARLRAVPGLAVDRVGDNVVARTPDAGAGRLILAGHLDTVPVNGNGTPRIVGDTLWGLGACDMKAGLAVMVELATQVPVPALGVTDVFYVAEEVARKHNGLLALAAARPDLLVGDAAILGEPTGARIEAGCQGVLKLDVHLGGRRAHAARPWRGINAIHRLAPLLDAVAARPEREPVLDGCRYREALQAVAVRGGVAANVVPDAATVSLNHRFAPDRSAEEAEADIRQLLEPLVDPTLGDHIELVETSPAAPPGLDHPLLARLLAGTGESPRAKLGWTDVAFFAERGIPAVNFGPGDSELAHSAEERVERHDLDAVYQSLWGLITAGSDVNA